MDLPNRKLTRLTGYDYSTPGAYFITICSFRKQCLFGSIVSGASVGDAYMKYSPIGEVAKKCLLDIESHFPNIKIDNWAIMPNHIHILLQIEDQTERIYPFPTSSVSNVIGTFKAAVSRRCKQYMHSEKVWQTSFYDHIIRNDEDYQSIWQYICGNPSKWLEDCFYCA